MGNLEQEQVNKLKESKAMASIFSKEFTIASYELDPRGEARLTTMANYFQEVAYHHANQLGFGYNQMKERRTLWMLSRMKIRMLKLPVWNDTTVVETWPSGIDKLFALRDFRVTDISGELLGVATTCWLIVDMNTHRPIRPGVELERFSKIVFGDPVFESNLEKIVVPDAHGFLGKHKVVFSDVDIVGHVNNVKYMEWSIDAVMPAGLTDRAIGEFEINFLHEALMGNHVVIRGGEESIEGATMKEPDERESEGPEGPFKLTVTREEDGQELIRASIRWKI